MSNPLDTYRDRAHSMQMGTCFFTIKDIANANRHIYDNLLKPKVDTERWHVISLSLYIPLKKVINSDNKDIGIILSKYIKIGNRKVYLDGYMIYHQHKKIYIPSYCDPDNIFMLNMYYNKRPKVINPNRLSDNALLCISDMFLDALELTNKMLIYANYWLIEENEECLIIQSRYTYTKRGKVRYDILESIYYK